MESLPSDPKKKRVNVTFEVDEKFDEKKMTKVKVKDNSQDPSQEMKVTVISEPAYVKPRRIDNFNPKTGLFHVLTTPDENNPWADCGHVLQVERANFKGPTQKALCENFMPTIGKSPLDDWEEGDFDKMVEFVKSFGQEGLRLIEGKLPETKVVEGKTVTTKAPVLESRVCFHRGAVCIRRPYAITGSVSVRLLQNVMVPYALTQVRLSYATYYNWFVQYYFCSFCTLLLYSMVVLNLHQVL